MEKMNLGKCCICETETDAVRNIISLDKKIPDEERSGGWGCFVCGLPARGAIAVLYDECLDKKLEIKWACLGYPKENRRIEIEKLTVPFGHDLSKHSEENNQDFIMCQNCQKIIAVAGGKCEHCGEEICIVCGCTESAACPNGCEWVRPNLCSDCDPLSLGIF